MRRKRRLALLVYGHQGPWVSTSGMLRPRLRITGLREGSVVLQTRAQEFHFLKDGTFLVPESEWMQICYHGEHSPGPICIINGEAA